MSPQFILDANQHGATLSHTLLLYKFEFLHAG